MRHARDGAGYGAIKPPLASRAQVLGVIRRPSATGDESTGLWAHTTELGGTVSSTPLVICVH
jgi:hypothetical protein